MPELTTIINCIAILAALSASTERAVELLKGSLPWLNEERATPSGEGRRKLAIQMLGVLCGALTAYLGREFLPTFLQVAAGTFRGALVMGLLLSGGSGFWNAILGYLRGIKDITALDAQEKRERSRAGGTETTVPVSIA